MAPDASPVELLRAPVTEAGYRYWVDEFVRFSDLDLIGHVNNRSYLDYAESVRAPFLREIGLWEIGRREQAVIAHTAIDYLQELHYPNRLRLGACVLHIGRSSCTLAQGVFREGGCTGTILTRLVWIDTTTRRPIPFGEAERTALGTWMRPDKESEHAH